MLQLPDADKAALSPRAMEMAAEVLVGIHVEKRFKARAGARGSAASGGPCPVLSL